MNKEESLSFLQSCIDKVNLATAQDIQFYREMYNKDCAMPMKSSEFEFVFPTDDFAYKKEKLDVIERKKMVLAMEYIARQINDEDVFEGWLTLGVADGDLAYGEWNPDVVEDYYIEDDNFRDLMDCFLRRMKYANKSGGLYCNGIVTKEG